MVRGALHLGPAFSLQQDSMTAYGLGGKDVFFLTVAYHEGF